MGDDENDLEQADETSRLEQLQREIADRKRKRQLLTQEEKNYDNFDNTEVVQSKLVKSDVQEEMNLTKKAKKKKAKNVEVNLEKSKEKRATKNATVVEDGDVNTYESSDESQEDNLSKVAKKKKAKKGQNKTGAKNTENEQGDNSQEKEENMEEIAVETSENKSEETGFTVIGGHKKDKEVKKVQRVLPDWLAKPTIINSDFSSNMTPVDKIPYLDPHIVRKLQQQNINHLFPVQSAVIPAILSQMETNSYFGRGGYEPSDICVSAPTGSGKTLAYVLPIVQSLVKRVVCHLRALIILPTKDLANQVKLVFEMFTEGTNLRVGLASGSKSFSKNQEQLVNLR